MQLKFNRQKSLKDSLLQKLLKLIVIVGIFVIVVFLLEKINFSVEVVPLHKGPIFSHITFVGKKI